MDDHAELIRTFYEAFGRKDYETMAQCYHADIHFTDPVFPNLHGDEARAMWHMLCDQGRELTVRASDISVDGNAGSAHWQATYLFTPTGRTVENDIDASFTFADGRIIRHVDDFDLWKWLRMAVGMSGAMIGWTNSAQERVRQTGADGLDRFLDEHPEYQRSEPPS